MSGAVRPGLWMLLDDAGSDTGALVASAAAVTAATLAAIVRHGSGFVLVTVEAATASRLDLPAMRGADPGGPAGGPRVSVDAAAGISTGISARDRARTTGLLADPTTVAADLRRPGHVVPVLVDTEHPRTFADRVHRAARGPAVYADVPGGPGGSGLAGPAELAALAAALGVPLVRTAPPPEEPDEFLGQLRASLLVGR